MDPELKTAHEWVALQNKKDTTEVITITDPDGWRRDDGVTIDTPITLEDFQDRLAFSTVRHERV